MHIDIRTRTDLTPTAKLVYSVIDDRTGQNADCWPGVRTLARDIGMSIPAVMRAIVLLEGKELIRVTNGGNGKSNHYVTTECERSRNDSANESSQEREQSVHTSANEPSTEALTKRSHNQTKEPDSKKQTKNQMPEPPEHLKEVWPEWVEARKDIKKKLTPRMAKGQLKKLSKFSNEAAVAAVEASIANGWQGLFPEQFETGPEDKRKRVDEILAGE